MDSRGHDFVQILGLLGEYMCSPVFVCEYA